MPAPAFNAACSASPFRTFDEIAPLGLEVHVYCPSCHRQTGSIDLGDDRLRGRAFSATRFVCSNNRTYGTAHPPRACGCLGYVMIKPGARDLIPPGRSIPGCSIECPRCVPYWEVSQAARHLPPWKQDLDAPRRARGLPGLRIAFDHGLARRRRRALYPRLPQEQRPGER